MTPAEAGRLVESLGAAFGAADVEAVMSLFAAEGDILYAGSEAGEVAGDRAALRVMLAELFRREERYSWRCHGVHVTSCAAGVAVLAEATLFVDPTLPSGQRSGAREAVPYRVSGLLEELHGAWRWRWCHGSEPVEAA